MSLPALPGDPSRYLANTRAASTRLAYARDWAHFQDWFDSVLSIRWQGAYSPQTIARYLSWCADQGAKPATLSRRLIAIGHAHEAAGHPNPAKDKLVRETMKGIRRTLGAAQRQAAPVLVPELKRMLATLPPTLLGIRDRALLLLGFASAMRRSELVALNLGDIEFGPRGLLVHVRKAKADQEGRGRKLVVLRGRGKTCPVRALEQWLEAGHGAWWKPEAGLTFGPVFCSVDRHSRVRGRLTPQAVRLVVARAAEAAGLPPRTAHGLRAGLATEAALAGATDREISKTTGHRSMRVLAGYVRDADLWRDNVSGRVGL